MVEMLATEVRWEVGQRWKFVFSQEMPVELGSKETLSKADQEALRMSPGQDCASGY